jgi:acyl carrier protein phosphodiesterase
MNYVAHLYLAKSTDEHRIGSLLADFTVGPLDALRRKYSDDIVEGIAHHRAVDRFTDTHDDVARALDGVKHHFGLYSGIVVDVVYDHFLLKHWARYAEIPTERFFDTVYRSLARWEWPYPERYRRVVTRLIEHRWLASYSDLRMVSYALKKVGTRFSKPTPLDDTFPAIKENYRLLEETFLTFFPDLVTYAKALTEQNDTAHLTFESKQCAG